MESDTSPDTDSISENTYSFSEENSDNVTFYRWQIVEKKITKSNVDFTFKDAAEMFKDNIKTLKEHIYTKRRQVNAYHEMKASLSESDLMLHVNFGESYKNDQQDATQSAYFGNQYFRIFTACCYAKSLLTKLEMTMSSLLPKVPTDHDRVAPLSCLQKVVHRIKHMHEKTY